MRHWMGGRSEQRLMHSTLLGGAISLALLYSSVTAAQGLLRYDLTLGADYRQAHLDWNVAGSLAGIDPNILSELTWRDLEIAQISGAVQVGISDHVIVRGSADYGEVVNGKNQDSDYDGDNRTFESSRSNNDTGGNITDASLGLGYHFRVYDQMAGHYAHVTPMVGYSRHLQHLKIKNGVQTFPATGSIAGLNSSYNAQWEGPWLGLNLRLEASERNSMIVDMAYHWADYYGEANWNLRDALAHPVSFRHDTQGAGIVAALALTHTLSKYWEVIARIESQHWTSDPGVDTAYDVSSGVVQPLTTRLNAVHWKSHTVGFAATYRF